MSTLEALEALEALKAESDNARTLYMAAVEAGCETRQDLEDRDEWLDPSEWRAIAAYCNTRLLMSQWEEARLAYRAARHQALATTKDPEVRHWLSVNS